MPQIEILSEREVGKAWQFAVQVLDDSGTLRQHQVMLSWADYNLWSADGADEPGKVAEAVIAFLLLRQKPGDLPAKIDASGARRKFEDADERIPGLIQR